MKSRIISALIGVAVFIPIIVFSDTILLPIAATAFSALAVVELFRCIGASRKYMFLTVSLLFAVSLPLLVGFLFGDILAYVGMMSLVACAYFTVMFCVLVFRTGKERFSAVAQMTVGTLYTTSGFTALVLLRELEHGFYLFLMPFFIAWMTDIMAYFSGRFFGKHKLCPTVSPKKTVEGAIGGLLLGTGVCVLVAFVLDRFSLVTPNYWFLIVSCLVLSALSQIGDLFASLIKREYGVKDFGNIMPGHGGVLDRFDSVLFITNIIFLIAGTTSLPPFFF